MEYTRPANDLQGLMKSDVVSEDLPLQDESGEGTLAFVGTAHLANERV